MKRRWLVGSLVVLSLVLALPASTQTPTHSVLTNGDFEVDTSGWAGGRGRGGRRVGAAEESVANGEW